MAAFCVMCGNAAMKWQLLGGRPIVRAFAIREVAGVAELSLFVALDAVNRFTVSAAAWLLFFWIWHGDRFRHSTT